jgi:hypothetical protein
VVVEVVEVVTTIHQRIRADNVYLEMDLRVELTLI